MRADVPHVIKDEPNEHEEEADEWEWGGRADHFWGGKKDKRSSVWPVKIRFGGTTERGYSRII